MTELHPTRAFRFAQQLASVVLTIVLALWLASSLSASAADEEFAGPFPSWRDVRRYYGAIGDGKADDSAAFQRGLDELIKHEKACVLYIPRGTYRLGSTLKTVRKAHIDCQVAIIGEDPVTTILLWDGADGGTMFNWDAWYSKISRLTFNGAKKAGAGLVYGPAFSTYNETSDLIFRDCKSGLVRLPCGRRKSGCPLGQRRVRLICAFAA